MATERERARSVPVIGTPALTGRDGELAALTGALSAAPALVLIEGEAGIGKSRLVREYLATAAGRRRRVIVACCPPFRRPLTLSPIVEALRDPAGDVGLLRLSPLAGALRPLFPEWAARLPPAPEPLEDSSAARHRLFRAVAELLGSLRVDVLVAEDVQWADEPTLEFLVMLASRPDPGVSLVVTYRPQDVPDDSMLLRLSSHHLAGGVAATRLALIPLDLPATTGLVSSLLGGQQITGQFARFLHERTDGIPLMVEESVRLLCERRDLIVRDGKWERRDLTDLQVPPTIRDSVLERLRRLSPNARLMLRAAAALGESARMETIAAVARVGLPGARTGALEAVRRGLLDDDGRGGLMFRHVLTSRAVYEDIPELERSQLHLRAGTVLEADGQAPAVRLARHFRAAHDDNRWAQHAEQAAEVAVAAGDDATAIAVLHDLLARARLPGSMCARLVIRLGTITIDRRVTASGLLSQVIELLRTVLKLPGLEQRDQGEIRLRLGRLLFHQGEVEAGRAELERAIPDLEHNPVEAARAMSYLSWPEIDTRPASVHLEWLQRYTRLLEGSSLSAAEHLVFTVDRVSALLLLGDEAGWEVRAQFPVMAATSGERQQLARGYLNTGRTAILWGRDDEARRRLTLAVDLAAADDNRRYRCMASLDLAHLDWMSGAWQGLAERITTLAGSDDAEASHQSDALVVLAQLDAVVGKSQSAARHLAALLDLTQRRGELIERVISAAALARLDFAEGRVEEALAVTEELVDLIAGKDVWLWATDILPPRLDALVAAGRDEEADRLASEFAHGLGGLAAPAPQASLVCCQAILAAARHDWLHAADLYGRAAEAWQAIPRPYPALQALDRQANCLLSAGREDAGLALLRSVLDGLTALGARADAERVAATLRGHGVALPRSARGRRPGGGDVLTARELEVVRLAATGCTNREIARSLGITSRTVAFHFTSARAKLNAPSRTALVATAMEEGLLPGRATPPANTP